MKSFGVALLLLTLLQSIHADQCNATLAHYLSPHSLGRQDQIADAMKILCGQIRPAITLYQLSRANYTLYNISVQCIYNDGRQTAEIAGNNTIQIGGGTIEFIVSSNYSIARTGASPVLGWIYASVVSNAVNFSKSIAREGAQTIWMITQGTDPKVEITSLLKLKRIEPKQTDDDVAAIVQALNTATTGITPANIHQQITTLVNQNYSKVLNQTLRQQVFNNVTQYTFYHPYLNEIGINYTNYLYKFLITPEDGFQLQYLSFIDGGSTKFCRYDLPTDHKSYDLYGGIQSALNMDLVRETARHIARKGWMNTAFENGWESNAFQMYVGDLFDVIPETKKLPPRTRLTGRCDIQDADNVDARRRGYEEIMINTSYNCSLVTNDTAKTLISEFTVAVDFYVRMVLAQEDITFVGSGTVASANFKPSGAYIVQDLDLANFKLSIALRSFVGYRVFGTGYKTWPRDNPQLQVDIGQKYIFMYDSSQKPHLIKS